MAIYRNSRRVSLTLLLVLALTLLPVPGPKAEASPTDAELCAALLSGVGALGGYRLRGADTDALREDYYMDYTVTLYRNTDYIILACGDETVRDIDLYIYDDNGNLVSQDRATDAAPVAQITPRWTAPFKVRVSMYDSVNGQRGYYTLAILYR